MTRGVVISDYKVNWRQLCPLCKHSMQVQSEEFFDYETPENSWYTFPDGCLAFKRGEKPTYGCPEYEYAGSYYWVHYRVMMARKKSRLSQQFIE